MDVWKRALTGDVQQAMCKSNALDEVGFMESVVLWKT